MWIFVLMNDEKMCCWCCFVLLVLKKKKSCLICLFFFLLLISIEYVNVIFLVIFKDFLFLGWLCFVIFDWCVLYIVWGGWGYREGYGGFGLWEEVYDILDMDIMCWESLWIDDSFFYLLFIYLIVKLGFYIFFLFGIFIFCVVMIFWVVVEGRMVSVLFWWFKWCMYVECIDYSVFYLLVNLLFVGKCGKFWLFLYKKKKKDVFLFIVVFWMDLFVVYGFIFFNILFVLLYIYLLVLFVRWIFVFYFVVDFFVFYVYFVCMFWVVGWDLMDSFDFVELEDDDDVVYVWLGDFWLRVKLIC